MYLCQTKFTMGLKSFFSRFTAKADVGQEVTDQSIFSPLSSAEKAQLIKQREVVEQYLADDKCVLINCCILLIAVHGCLVGKTTWTLSS